MASARTRRGQIAAVGILVVAAAVVAAIVTSRTPSPTTTSHRVRRTGGTATVRQRNLVEADTEPGTLGYADPQTVYNRLSGTITWLPHVGRVIHAGQTLFKVDERPVILMRGSTPAYRALGSSDPAGSDIEQLNRNLSSSGSTTAHS